MIGMLTSGGSLSTISYTGAPIGSRFSTTTENQELVKFTDDNNKQLSVNSFTIEAGASDLYFTLWIVPKSILKNPVENFNFTGQPVLFCPAGETVTISGLKVGAIKFSNNLGAEYFIQALYF